MRGEEHNIRKGFSEAVACGWGGGGWRGGGGERALQTCALMAILFQLHAYNRQQIRATNANQQYELLE